MYFASRFSLTLVDLLARVVDDALVLRNGPGREHAPAVDPDRRRSITLLNIAY
jgi:hypothetical protein